MLLELHGTLVVKFGMVSGVLMNGGENVWMLETEAMQKHPVQKHSSPSQLRIPAIGSLREPVPCQPVGAVLGVNTPPVTEKSPPDVVGSAQSSVIDVDVLAVMLPVTCTLPFASRKLTPCPTS